MSERLKENRILIENLKTLVEKHPEQRFSQILLNFGFVKQVKSPNEEKLYWKNEFYIEPDDVIKRLKLDL